MLGFSVVSVFERRYLPTFANGLLKTVISKQLLAGVVQGNQYPWPAGSQSIDVYLDASEFVDSGHQVRVFITCDWGGGRILTDETVFVGGTKGKGGNTPHVKLGPFKGRDGVIDNPQTVTIAIEPLLGQPKVGLLCNVA